MSGELSRRRRCSMLFRCQLTSVQSKVKASGFACFACALVTVHFELIAEMMDRGLEEKRREKSLRSVLFLSFLSSVFLRRSERKSFARLHAFALSSEGRERLRDGSLVA